MQFVGQSAVLAILKKPPICFYPRGKKKGTAKCSFAVRGGTILSATGEEVSNLLSPRRHDQPPPRKKKVKGEALKKFFAVG